MKKIRIIWLAAFLMLQGCSPAISETVEAHVETEVTSASVSESAKESESSTEETVESTEEIPEEDHLELVEMGDYSPGYNLILKKIEGGTGNELNFTTAELTAEPEDGINGLFIRDPVDTNLLSFSFWNVNGMEPITFTIDNLDYTFEIPQTEVRRLKVDQQIIFGDYSVVIKEADLYPKAIVLYLSDISNSDLFKNFIFLNVNSERFPPYSFDVDDAGRRLLYTFEEEITVEEIESIEIGNRDESVITVLNFSDVDEE